MEHRRARRDGVLGWSVTLYAHLPALDSFGGRSAAENDTRWRERERPRAESYRRSRRSRSTMPRGPERPSGSANWHRSSKANSCRRWPRTRRACSTGTAPRSMLPPRPSPSAAASSHGAHAWIANCEGSRTPALALADHHDDLTPREREVATLAARGLTDQGIAEQLLVSVRTVHAHLRSTYAKLGVGGRSELGRVLGPASGSRK